MPLISALAAVAARGYGFLQGRASAYELIETQTVGAGGAASITFSSIPSTYKHLQIRGICRVTDTARDRYTPLMQFNSDTGSNYSIHYLFGDGTAPFSGSGTNTSHVVAAHAPTSYSGFGQTFGATTIDILDYANTAKYKTVRTLDGVDMNGDALGGIVFNSGAWRSTSAINALRIYVASTNFAQHSTFSLYGIR